MDRLLPVALIALCALAACTPPQRAESVIDMGVTFDWSGTRACSSVPPSFTLSAVPDGTENLIFRMVDRDVPSFRHGGGVVAYTDPEVEAGAFSYTGPCPPNGETHSYEWTVQAVNGEGVIIGEGTAREDFPPTD